jgi:2-iminobutanoate/2-iminopropanoate deaminase
MRQVVHTDAAPQAIGPYSQAIRCGGFLFVSGQIAIDPVTGDLTVGDVGAQTERVLKNAGEILLAGGATLDTVVKTTVYLMDMEDFGRMNEVYSLFFGDTPPARSTVAVAGLPRGVRVEIDFIAQVTASVDVPSPSPRGATVAKRTPEAEG